MAKTVWRLHRSSGNILECCVDRTPSKAHTVTVVLGHETFLRESYPDEPSALDRAMQVREGLLKSGWATVSHTTVAVS